MDWKKWLGYNLYKKLWFWAGRPFTYILRDVWHKLEYFPQMQWLGTGVIAEYLRQRWHLPWWIHFIWIGIYTYGYINGHLFWGARYKPGQKDGGKK